MLRVSRAMCTLAAFLKPGARGSAAESGSKAPRISVSVEGITF